MNEITQLAKIFKALSDPTRLKLVHLLSQNKQLCVNAMTNKTGVTQSAVSQHLRILRDIGLVNAERLGVNIHYSLNKELLKNYKSLILEVMGKEFIIIE